MPWGVWLLQAVSVLFVEECWAPRGFRICPRSHPGNGRSGMWSDFHMAPELRMSVFHNHALGWKTTNKTRKRHNGIEILTQHHSLTLSHGQVWRHPYPVSLFSYSSRPILQICEWCLLFSWRTYPDPPHSRSLGPQHLVTNCKCAQAEPENAWKVLGSHSRIFFSLIKRNDRSLTKIKWIKSDVRYFFFFGINMLNIYLKK